MIEEIKCDKKSTIDNLQTHSRNFFFASTIKDDKRFGSVDGKGRYGEHTIYSVFIDDCGSILSISHGGNVIKPGYIDDIRIPFKDIDPLIVVNVVEGMIENYENN